MNNEADKPAMDKEENDTIDTKDEVVAGFSGELGTNDEEVDILGDEEVEQLTVEDVQGDDDDDDSPPA